MINRRVLLQGSVARLLSQLMIPEAQVADASSKQSLELLEIYQQNLPALNLNNWVVTAIEVTFPPDAPLFPTHRHSGFVIGYVLEGEFRFQLEGQPETIFSAGQIFYEPPESIHVIGSSASDTKQAKILALIFGEKGKEPTTLV